MVLSRLRSGTQNLVSNVRQKATNVATTVKSAVTKTPTPAPTPPKTTTPTIASQLGLTNTPSQRLFEESVERKQEYNKNNPTTNRLDLLTNTPSQRLFEESVKRKQDSLLMSPDTGYVSNSSLMSPDTGYVSNSSLMSPDTGYVPPWQPPTEPISKYQEDRIIQQITEPTQDERRQRETTLSQLGYMAQPTGRVTMGFGYGPMLGYQAIRTRQRDNVIKDYAADFFNKKQLLPQLDPGYKQAQKSVDRMFGANIVSGKNFRAEFGDPIERTKKKMRKFL